MADAKQQDPNAKTDATLRKEFEAKQAQQKKDAQERAEKAGGTGMISEQPLPERKVEPMDPQRVELYEFSTNRWMTTAPEGCDITDLQKPEFWSLVSGKLKPWNEIFVRANDALWYARLVVLEAGRNWARMHVEHVEYLTTQDVAITQADAMSPYEIKHRGPHAKWSVIRKTDRQVVHEGSETMDGATAWIKGRLQADK